MLNAVAIIPARYASTRLPGKLALRDPAGKCLIEYVAAAAARAKTISRVIIATDDQRIFDIAAAAGFEAQMTSPDHPCGTDRIAEVAAALDADIIVNCQADEPQLRPEMVDQAVQLLEKHPDCPMSTLACEIQTEEEFADPNLVKVVVDSRSRALYFSRATIPFVRGAKRPVAECPLRPLHHIGLYGFRRDFLLQYARLPKSPLEEAEKLEQLRALYNGYHIAVGVTPYQLIGVDTAEDFAAFCATVGAHGRAPQK
jgi:3-deoxy-manno-octulosonate cytidylyltransferase (CMP-KDO synthetase)